MVDWGKIACALGWHDWHKIGMTLWLSSCSCCRRCLAVKEFVLLAGGATVHYTLSEEQRREVRQRMGWQ